MTIDFKDPSIPKEDTRLEVIAGYPATPFREIDFVRGLPVRLHKRITQEKGQVNVVEFFLDATRTLSGALEFATPVVRETHTYARTSLGLPLSRRIVIEWFTVGGDIHPLTKIRDKYYTVEEQLREGETRRRNIINNLKTRLIGLIQLTEGVSTLVSFGLAQNLFDTHQAAIVSYLEAGSPGLAVQIEHDITNTWLSNTLFEGSVTIRDAILAELS